MHRTRFILEDWQYQTLRARAEREGRSLSERVRDILSRALARPEGSKSRLQSMEGVGEDPPAYGRRHDDFLYGRRDRN